MMENKNRRTVKDRRISDRRNRVDSNYKRQERRIKPNRRTVTDRRKSD